MNTIETYELFKDKTMKELAMELMKGIPDYFWKVGASSSGKYHSESERKEGGLWRHTEALCFIAKDLYRSGLFGLTRRELDLAYLTLHLHDTFARGVEEELHTVTEHPLLAGAYFRSHPASKILSADEIEVVAKAIERHMGRWTHNYSGEQILEAPETELERFVHLCDYVGSRKTLEFIKENATTSMY